LLVVLQQHQIYIRYLASVWIFSLSNWISHMGKPKFVMCPFINPVFPSRSLTFCPLWRFSFKD
jgi:hypothetical protein